MSLEEGRTLAIDIEEWSHTCSDGCCYSWGYKVYLNGEEIQSSDYSIDEKELLVKVLEKLGYKVIINEK